MAKQKNHIPGFAERLLTYTEERLLDLHQYSPYHLRITDGGYVAVDCWTTGRYYVLLTDYEALGFTDIVERQGEKGQLPVNNLQSFLDKLFFTEEL
jgi:hypothetical protein